MSYFGYPTVNVPQIIGAASNIRSGTNPAYTTEDFLANYPQFGNNAQGNPIAPLTVIQLYIDLAQNCIMQARWKNSWKIAMGLFIAHWCQLWLRNSADPANGKDAVVAVGSTQGITTSESVDGVSYSMDVTSIVQDLSGYALWTTTDYGAQLATLAKVYGKGMILVY